MNSEKNTAEVSHHPLFCTRCVFLFKLLFLFKHFILDRSGRNNESDHHQSKKTGVG